MHACPLLCSEAVRRQRENWLTLKALNEEYESKYDKIKGRFENMKESKDVMEAEVKKLNEECDALRIKLDDLKKQNDYEMMRAATETRDFREHRSRCASS